MHLVHAVHVGYREVQVKTTATLVGPRLSNKGCVLSGARDNLFDCRLENESSVSRIECFAVPKIDLILRWAELVVTCEHTNVKLIEHSHQVQESSLRVNQGASGVNPTGSGERALVYAVFRYIGDVEL